MPTYAYIAKSQPDRTLQGEIEAETEQDAIKKLTRMGYFPISVKAGDLLSDTGQHPLSRGISKKETLLFIRQLASLVESGVNIINGLAIIQGQTSNIRLKAILDDIIGKIKDGKSLSDAFSAHPRLFPSLYTSIIQSGEAGGHIEESLKRLADFAEKEEEFKNSIRASLTYPAFVILVGAATIVVLLGFVIPRLVGMFKDMGQLLPLPTKMLINISTFLRHYWWFILAVVFISIFSLRRIYREPKSRLSLDKLKLRIPALGQIILKAEIGRLMRTLSLLLTSGIPIVRALEVSTSVMDNQALVLEAQGFREKITDGASFSKALGGSLFFPAFVTNIVNVGEETGTLERALLNIADDYEREVDRSLKAFTRLLEPVIILVVGLIVGFIVLSMLLPIFQINLIVR